MYGVGGMGVMSLSVMQARKDRRGKRSVLPDEVAKRLKSCSVLSCEEWRDLESYTTYHCFPTGDKNQERWEIWTQLLRKTREDASWIPFRGSLVCSHHFRPEDFVNDPLSKRRKLIKNAIPSIFPTFTVDLSDPTYHIADETDYCNGDESGEWMGGNDANDQISLTGVSDGFSFEEAEANDYEYDYSTADNTDNTVYEDESGSQSLFSAVASNEDAGVESDDDDIQIISTTSHSHMKVSGNNSSGKAVNTGTFSVPSSSGKVLLVSQLPSPSLPRKVSAGSNHVRKQDLHPKVAATDSQASSPKFVKTGGRKPLFSVVQVQQDETEKALSSLPFSLNPDLEIELIDPEEDLSACRQRISELEQENRSLTAMYENELKAVKEKYESELRAMRRKLVQQQQRLANNQMQMSSDGSISFSSPKKIIRLS